MDLPAARMNTSGAMSHMPMVQPTDQACTSPPGARGQDRMPRRPSCVRLPEFSVSQALATGALDA